MSPDRPGRLPSGRFTHLRMALLFMLATAGMTFAILVFLTACKSTEHH